MASRIDCHAGFSRPSWSGCQTSSQSRPSSTCLQEPLPIEDGGSDIDMRPIMHVLCQPPSPSAERGRIELACTFRIVIMMSSASPVPAAFRRFLFSSFIEEAASEGKVMPSTSRSPLADPTHRCSFPGNNAVYHDQTLECLSYPNPSHLEGEVALEERLTMNIAQRMHLQFFRDLVGKRQAGAVVDRAQTGA